MEKEKSISESAFLVNESRARNVGLSRDRYAELWVSDETRKLWEDFSHEVYPLDDVELGLRNRFYLDVLERALDDDPGTVFVNLAAGFTSYPYLTERAFRALEVDFVHVCDYKRARVGVFEREGRLPERYVELVGCDLRSVADLNRLRVRLSVELRGVSSVAFLEGITYYLEREVLLGVFGLLGRVQEPGSLIAVDFWTPDTATHPVHIRFRKFCASRFGHDEGDYTLFETSFFESLKGYELIDSTDIVGLEGRFSGERKLAGPEEILPERYAVLRRQRERR